MLTARTQNIIDNNAYERRCTSATFGHLATIPSLRAYFQSVSTEFSAFLITTEDWVGVSIQLSVNGKGGRFPVRLFPARVAACHFSCARSVVTITRHMLSTGI